MKYFQSLGNLITIKRRLLKRITSIHRILAIFLASQPAVSLDQDDAESSRKKDYNNHFPLHLHSLEKTTCKLTSRYKSNKNNYRYRHDFVDGKQEYRIRCCELIALDQSDGIIEALIDKINQKEKCDPVENN